MTSLAIVERAYRGAVEVSYFDALYLGIEIHRQLGLDVLLRGEAVGYAVAAAPAPPIKIGGRVLETLDAPRDDLLRLRDQGAGIWVEEDGLAALGIGPERLIEGVRCVAPAELARHWPEYDRVFYL
ncbi:hypothetical protein ACWGH5_18100 [Streptomyces sp. NPDC054864]